MGRGVTFPSSSMLYLALFLFELAAPLSFHSKNRFHGTKKLAFRKSSHLLAVTPSLVSVCTAELCCCQEEGLGGDEILEDLLSRNLPYPIEEAPCLGACGGGAMVAVDFEDGGYALVAGIDETLQELGLAGAAETTAVDSSTQTMEIASEAGPADVVENEMESDNALKLAKEKEITLNSLSENTDIPVMDASVEKGDDRKIRITPPVAPKPSRKSVELVDVRDRMRAEAEKDEEQVNPWMNAAAYLAKKAGEKLFSS